MADPYIIKSPELSFFQVQNSFIDDSACISGRNICLPIANGDDHAFQFQVTADSAFIAQQILDAPNTNGELIIVSMNGVTEIYNFTIENNLYFKKYRTASNEITYVWNNSLDELQEKVLPGVCFRFKTKLTLEINGTVYVSSAISNCYHLTTDVCHTSRITFNCEEDAYGFRYCNTEGFRNIARIPAYLAKPQFIDDQTIYPRSDGSFKILKSVTRKEFEGVTELLAKEFHEKITMALNHDYVAMVGANYDGGIRKNGGYNIDWDEDFPNLPAQAKFKANSTPYNQRNNNCANCQPVVVPGVCGAINNLIAEIEESVEAYSALITGVEYVDEVIANQVMAIFYREAGSATDYVSWGAITCNTTGDVIGCESPALSPGYHVQGFLEIPEIPPFWENVEIKAVMVCNEEEYEKNFAAVGDSCPPVHDIIISGITDNSAEVSFTGPLFLPPGGYNWDLRNGDDELINFGNTSLTTISLVGLESGTSYYISIVSNCEVGDFSTPVVSETFETL